MGLVNVPPRIDQEGCKHLLEIDFDKELFDHWKGDDDLVSKDKILELITERRLEEDKWLDRIGRKRAVIVEWR